MSTTLLIGRTPHIYNLRCIHFGDGSIFTSVTNALVYAAQSEEITVTDGIFISDFEYLYSKDGYFMGIFNAAETSLANPSML